MLVARGEAVEIGGRNDANEMKLKTRTRGNTFILEINHYASQVQSATYYHTSTLRTQRFGTLFLTVPLAT